MDTGFYLDENISEFGFEALELVDISEMSDFQDTAYDYLHGKCYRFAKYLNERYGYKLVVLTSPIGKLEDLVHVANIISLNGITHWIDIRGMTSSWERFIDEFEDFWTEGDGYFEFSEMEDVIAFMNERCSMSDSDFEYSPLEKEALDDFVNWHPSCYSISENVSNKDGQERFTAA